MTLPQGSEGKFISTKDGYFNQTYVTLLIEVHGLTTLENRTVERCIVCNIAQSITDIS